MSLDELIAQMTNPQDFTNLCNSIFIDIYGHNFQVIDGSRSDNGNDGYQCQTCGKFASREYINPFSNCRSGDSGRPLGEAPLEYRPSRVQSLLMAIGLIESQMQTTPKENWRASWEENLAHFQGELACIPAEELERIKLGEEESDAAYEASLFCECGGSLSREHVIFCPKCGATHMLYKCEYLT